LVGKDYSSDELTKEILKDKIIFEESCGGVTFSGGEPLLQSDFLVEVMGKLKKEDIHIAVDTSGYVPYENIRKIIEYTDLFLYDLKIADQQKHIVYTGVSNKLIIENLIKLSNEKSDINLRIPVIKGVNDSKRDMDEIIRIIDQTEIQNISLLPYHNLSAHKYRKIDLAYEVFEIPDAFEMNRIKHLFESRGYTVQIGG
jgi:pyruvate formate lyase activating enzyme